MSDAEARFLVVGAFAFGRYARPRATGDLDLWIDAEASNADRVYAALRAFGAPLGDLRAEELREPNLVFQLGSVPGRIDLLTTLSGIDFDSAWERRQPGDLGGVPVAFISREDLIRNKRALARPRDLADVAELEER